jgi:hypothetical protein
MPPSGQNLTLGSRWAIAALDPTRKFDPPPLGVNDWPFGLSSRMDSRVQRCLDRHIDRIWFLSEGGTYHSWVPGAEHVFPQTVRFLAVILTAIALVPARAHFLELPNKIVFHRPTHLSRLGPVWLSLGAIGADFRDPNEPYAFWLALLAFLLITSSLVIFFIWTYRANQATSKLDNRPSERGEPEDTMGVFARRERSDDFLALCAVMASLLVSRR